MIAKLFISSSQENIKNEIDKKLEIAGLKNPHPDLLYFPYDSKLGIEQARQIKKHLSYKPHQAKGKAVVLEDGGNLTIEAQNALLKTLEELPEHAQFLMGSSSESKLLPTVLSRCEVIQIPDVSTQSTPGVGLNQEIEKLLGANLEERFEYIANLKEKEWFLQSLVKYFHQNLASHIKDGDIEFLKELLASEKRAKHNVNIRAILEYLMLKMPENS